MVAFWLFLPTDVTRVVMEMRLHFSFKFWTLGRLLLLKSTHRYPRKWICGCCCLPPCPVAIPTMQHESDNMMLLLSTPGLTPHSYLPKRAPRGLNVLVIYLDINIKLTLHWFQLILKKTHLKNTHPCTCTHPHSDNLHTQNCKHLMHCKEIHVLLKKNPQKTVLCPHFNVFCLSTIN